MDCGDELLDIAHSILEQVANSLSGVGKQLQREPELDVLRQDEDTNLLVVGTDLERRAQPLVAVRRWQADVDDGNVGCRAAHQGEQIGCRVTATDDLESLVEQQAFEALAQEHAVLGDHDAHGISALTRVPPPFGVHT